MQEDSFWGGLEDAGGVQMHLLGWVSILTFRKQK